MSTPLHRLLSLFNMWHATRLASDRLTEQELVRWLNEWNALANDVPIAELEAAPVHYEAKGDAHCTRCGRHLKRVYELNGAPFGSVCVRKEIVNG